MTNSLAEWLQRLEKMQPDKMKLGLDRIEEVARSAGLAHPSFKIITVAGTNGKGSTVAYISRILGNLNLSVGVYTSPHFINFNERIVIDGCSVEDAGLCAAFDHIEQSRGAVALTYFEFTTLAAIYCFSQRNIDVAVLEVGLGGRLDAVNAWDSELACISSIGIDHIDWLGDNREAIGFEKAGVARRGCPLICGDLNPPASIASAANDVGAKLLQSGEHFGVTASDSGRFCYYGLGNLPSLPLPAIPGQWAVQNAAVAICACEQYLGDAVPETAVQKALRGVTITGRMQHAVFRSVSVLLDVAHNQQAASLLAGYLASEAEPVIAVFGCMQDKDCGAIVECLRSTIDIWCLAQIDYPRAMRAEKIQELVGVGERHVFASVIQAFDAAVAQSGGRYRVVVFGSFHVVGPVVEYIETDTQFVTEEGSL